MRLTIAIDDETGNALARCAKDASMDLETFIAVVLGMAVKVGAMWQTANMEGQGDGAWLLQVAEREAGRIRGKTNGQGGAN